MLFKNKNKILRRLQNDRLGTHKGMRFFADAQNDTVEVKRRKILYTASE
jgi:hypothetical protein